MRMMEQTLLLTALSFAAAGGALAAGGGGGGGGGALDAAEESHLVFMREEEKLARDVYIALAGAWPAAPTFQNIVPSEQNHTDTVASKLAQYGIADPSTDDTPGVFTGAEWGWYFDQKYAYLTGAGANSELDALYVGAFIEELDMHDIVLCPEVIVTTNNGITDCGLEYTDEAPLQNVYSNLVAGSESHLRAYVGAIEAVIGEGNYVAQYLSQAEVDAILGR
ncbi:DUF2202 domain-containing protein [Endothiovibrio diazotrophicus]